MIDRVQPVGVAGIAGHEDQLVVGRRRPRSISDMLDLGRLVVFVDAEEADIEIVARILEVVGVAAEEGDLPAPARRPAARRCISCSDRGDTRRRGRA